VSYTALYNVSIYSVGSSQIIDAKLVAALNNDINDVDNTNIEPGLRLSALKLLQSLLRNVCTQTTYNILKNNVSYHDTGIFFYPFKIHLCSIIIMVLKFERIVGRRQT